MGMGRQGIGSGWFVDGLWIGCRVSMEWGNGRECVGDGHVMGM